MTAESSLCETNSLDLARGVADRLRRRLCAAVIGRDDVIDLVLIALLGDGHVLLEDHPGSGKTTLARTLGESIQAGAAPSGMAAFRRIQFTSDLMPSDITGGSVFDTARSVFEFHPGPVFTHLLLADEINRTSPKVQAALLEAMAEKQVTVDNTTHRLDELFFVIATQNPRDTAGTYPLPAPQLDRFLFKIRMSHIGRDAELAVLRAAHSQHPSLPAAVVSRDEILQARAGIRHDVHISAAVQECLVDAASALRSHAAVAQGPSTRSLVLMTTALQAAALLRDRDFVSAADVELLAPHVFTHRLVMARGGQEPDAVVRECLAGPLERLARHTLSRRQA